MINENFTNSPWHVVVDGDGWFYVEDDRGYTVCDVKALSCEHENAHLISAAPDLYGALIKMGELLEADAFTGDYYDSVVVPLLAKARGEL